MSRLTEWPLPTLVKVASAIVHAEEYLSDSGAGVDRIAFESLLKDPDVKAFMDTLNEAGFLPKKR